MAARTILLPSLIFMTLSYTGKSLQFSNRKLYKIMRTIKTMTDELRLQIIQEYLDGASKYSLKRKYNLRDSKSISSWMLKFGIENPRSQPKPLFLMPKKKESQEIEDLKKQIKQLKKDLAFSEMKADALDTMITLAEKQLQIPIRKKSGAKQ